MKKKKLNYLFCFTLCPQHCCLLKVMKIRKEKRRKVKCKYLVHRLKDIMLIVKGLERSNEVVLGGRQILIADEYKLKY